MPTVSVIIPTYNRRHLLGRAVQSVLDQTYRDFELVIVDDGSTDDTESLIQDFNDSRIRYVRHEGNRGNAAALNTGIEATAGEYISFHDSDDVCLPEKLAEQVQAFEAAPPATGLVHTAYYRIIGNRSYYMPPAGWLRADGDTYSSLLRSCCSPTPTIMIRRECLVKTGPFAEGFLSCVDWEFLLRLSRHYRCRFIDRPLLHMYPQPDSISANKDNNIRSLKQLLESNYEDFSRDEQALAGHYLGLGILLCISGEPGEGRGNFIRSIKRNPRCIKTWGALLLSLLGGRTFARVFDYYRRIRVRIDSSYCPA